MVSEFAPLHSQALRMAGKRASNNSWLQSCPNGHGIERLLL